STHQINPVITLYSPIKGKVVEIKVVPGEMVDQAKDMMVIVDPRVLWVDAEIFEKDIARVHPGQKVEITVPAYPGKTFVGRISYVGDVLKEETRTITVRTEVENKNLELKPGMFATLKINLNGDRKVLAVPEAAVCDQKGEKFVFVPQGEGFELRKVELGARQDGFYEVISGLKEGELVVTTGSFQLKSKLFESVLKEAIHD
ncbi:MAG: efflux RND transporter periplasmic adaptor subunit, partial [Candidatus Aminicenantes bacterium]|nr:efflux RND transporter periplasmic adaptor subunit [Candidatus Aminicenantes bacterium]